MKLHIGDQILVTSGKDKGQKGTVDHVFPVKDRVLVQGVNVYKKARRGFGNKPGGMIEFSRPLSTASIALLCPKCAKPTRVGYLVDKRGEKVRICKKCKAVIEPKKNGK